LVVDVLNPGGTTVACCAVRLNGCDSSADIDHTGFLSTDIFDKSTTLFFITAFFSRFFIFFIR
jgi:hypothetical protein